MGKPRARDTNSVARLEWGEKKKKREELGNFTCPLDYPERGC